MNKILMTILMTIPLAVNAQKQDAKVEPPPIDMNKALYSLGVAVSQNLMGYNFTESESG